MGMGREQQTVMISNWSVVSSFPPHPSKARIEDW